MISSAENPRTRAARRPARSAGVRLGLSLSVVILLAGAGFSAAPQEDRPPTGRAIWPAVVGDGLQTLDGQPLERQQLEGRWVLLDFWATWCAPCIAELPTLRRIHETWQGTEHLILGVSMNRSSRARVMSWIERQRAEWLQLHDGQGFAGPVARALGVEVVPRTLLVDPAGRIVAVDLRGDELISAIETLVPTS